MIKKDKNQIVVSWGFLERHENVEVGSILYDEGILSVNPGFYEVDYISLEAEIVILNIL